MALSMNAVSGRAVSSKNALGTAVVALDPPLVPQPPLAVPHHPPLQVGAVMRAKTVGGGQEMSVTKQSVRV